MIAMSFDGKRIKAAAAQAGLSLTELAGLLNVSRATLYAYVANNINPPEERISQLAELTGCSVDFFVAKPEPSVVMAQVDASLRLVEAMLTSSDPHAAARVLESCLDDVPKERRGELMLRTGNALVMGGEYQEAIPNLVRALSEFKRTGDRNCEGRCHQSLGFCYAHVGPLQKARECFVEAEAHLNEDSRWKARVALAVVEERRGNFDQALDLVRKAEGSSSEPGASLFCRGVRSNIFASRGDWQSVHQEELAALRAAEELGANDQIAERLIMSSLAAIYVRDPKTEFRVAHALGFLQSARDKARQAFFLTVRSAYSLASGQFEEAETYAMQALSAAIIGKYRRAELGAYLRLAEAEIAQEKFHEAELTLFKAIAYADSYEYAAEKAYAEALTAFVSANLGQARKAQDYLAKCNRVHPIHSAILDATEAMLHKGTWDWEGIGANLASRGVAYVPGFTVVVSHIGEKDEV